MNLVGDVGLAMLVVAAVIVLVSALTAVSVTRRVVRLGREVDSRAAELVALVNQSRASMSASAQERETVLRPLSLVRRYVSHPLALALFESYARRRRARKAAGA